MYRVCACVEPEYAGIIVEVVGFCDRYGLISFAIKHIELKYLRCVFSVLFHIIDDIVDDHWSGILGREAYRDIDLFAALYRCWNADFCVSDADIWFLAEVPHGRRMPCFYQPAQRMFTHPCQFFLRLFACELPLVEPVYYCVRIFLRYHSGG